MLLGWGLSDIGQIREANEDHCLLDLELGLLLVCDGMGGHVGGATASRTAAAAFRDALRVRADAGGLRGRGARQVVGQAASAASIAVYDKAEADPGLSGMGTTLTGLIVHEGVAHVAHVGDSRAYLMRNGRLRQITEDHSLVQEQVRAGLLSENEARHSRLRNVITRSVGFNREVEVDLLSFPTRPGDTFVLCSDGLTGPVDDNTLSDIVDTAFLGKAVHVLVDLANAMGGEDNITVVIGHILE
jgi:PPM family protein phosphatase